MHHQYDDGVIILFMTEPKRISYESMGTHWSVSIWDDIDRSVFADIEKNIVSDSTEFDHTYSRFIKDSLIWKLTGQKGNIAVPPDLVRMLRLYEKLFDASQGKCNPLVGFALSDLGYDADYSLTPKQHVRPVPDFHAALKIMDDTHIVLTESVLIDLGALGKGYFVDHIAHLLRNRGLRHFLVDGSGDVYFKGGGEKLRAGLEHPEDPTKVIGVLEIAEGALCASASNRRKWRGFHHTIDPDSLTSPQDIIATWVLADNAAVADGLATCLFLCEPEEFAEWEFEYCILRKDFKVKKSAGFNAELF